MAPYLPFICRYAGCGARYPFIHNLREHDRMHSRIRPFHCRFCSHSSAYQGSIMKHLRRRHFPNLTSDDGRTFINKLCAHVDVDEVALDMEAIEMDQWVASEECRSLIGKSDAAGFGDGEGGGTYGSPKMRRMRQQQPIQQHQESLPGNSARVYAQMQEFLQEQDKWKQQIQTQTQTRPQKVIQNNNQPIYDQRQQNQRQQLYQQSTGFMRKRSLVPNSGGGSAASKMATNQTFSHSSTSIPPVSSNSTAAQQAQSSNNKIAILRINNQTTHQQRQPNFGSNIATASNNSASIFPPTLDLSELSSSNPAAAAIAAATIAQSTRNSASNSNFSQLSPLKILVPIITTTKSPAANVVMVKKPKVTATTVAATVARQSPLAKSSAKRIVSNEVITINDSDDDDDGDRGNSHLAPSQPAHTATVHSAKPVLTNESHNETNKDSLNGVKESNKNVEDSQEAAANNDKRDEGNDAGENGDDSQQNIESNQATSEDQDGTSIVNEEEEGEEEGEADTTATSLSIDMPKISMKGVSCSHCGRTNFACFRDFAHHDRTHSGLRPYVCTFNGCSLATATKSATKKHLLKVHRNHKRKAGEMGTFPDDFIYEDLMTIEIEKVRLLNEITGGNFVAGATEST